MTDATEIEILLVEDDANDAELTMMALRKHQRGEKVFHVSDGAEAVSFLTALVGHAGPVFSSNLRLVILDLKLPKLTGLEVLHHIRTDERTKLIPVVILTSSAEAHDILECYRSGANAYVVKPLVFEEFVETVGRLAVFWTRHNHIPLSVSGEPHHHDVAAE